MMSRKMFKTVLIMSIGMVLIVIGCFKFLTIEQPESIKAGEKFQVYLEVQSETDYNDENPNWGIFGIMMPLGWWIDSVYYEGDYGTGYAEYLHPDSIDKVPGKYDYWADSLTLYFPPPEGMQWIVYQSIESFSITADPKYKYFDVYVDINSGHNAGNYNLGYFITMASYELADTSWYDVSLGNSIEVINTAPTIDLPDTIHIVNNQKVRIDLPELTQDNESPSEELAFNVSMNTNEIGYFLDEGWILELNATGYVGTAELYVEVYDQGGLFGYDTTIVNAIDYTALESSENIIPAKYALHNNYPNPFNPSTTINFDLIRSTRVKLEIYDALGQKVETLIDGFRAAGTYQYKYYAGSLGSGIYYYVLITPDFRKAHKMLLVK